MKNFKIRRTPTIRRMPTYLHKLYCMQAEGKTYASCTDLAKYMNIELIVARKDIAMTGLAGHRRYGYKIDDLIVAIRKFVGWDTTMPAVLVGAGALGSALLGYSDFALYGMNIQKVFDSSPERIGKTVHGHEVLDASRIREQLSENTPKVGIICVSTESAQKTADLLISLGIRYLWNFANVCLTVPENVIVQREVIAGGLAVLATKIRAVESGAVPEEE